MSRMDRNLERRSVPLDINWNEPPTRRHGKTRSNQRLRTLEIDNDGRIAESKGHVDSAEYERQLKHGVN
jgi:hypothetical protein